MSTIINQPDAVISAILPPAPTKSNASFTVSCSMSGKTLLSYSHALKCQHGLLSEPSCCHFLSEEPCSSRWTYRQSSPCWKISWSVSRRSAHPTSSPSFLQNLPRILHSTNTFLNFFHSLWWVELLQYGIWWASENEVHMLLPNDQFVFFEREDYTRFPQREYTVWFNIGRLCPLKYSPATNPE